MDLVIYCADIGSVPNRRFGWARGVPDDPNGPGGPATGRHSGGDIGELVDAVAADLAAGCAVALGFEYPLFVPVPERPLRLGAARTGEGNRSWSAGAGAGALATGIVEVAWILGELRRRAPAATAYLDWSQLTTAGRGLFVWEAFVTDRAKATTHVGDAALAVAAFREALPYPPAANAVGGERPLSLVGAALLWSGWSDRVDVLSAPCLVIKAAARAAERAEAGDVGAAESVRAADPSTAPRAHRDPRAVERKRALLEAPHVAPLTDYARRLRAARGSDSVPWFDPAEAGVDASILLLFENPGRRADAVHGSGFISADNDDRTAETVWHLCREVGVDRARALVSWNIVPWYLGDEHRIGTVRTRDLDEARPALLELLGLLPRLRAVVLFGQSAQRGWERAGPPRDIAVLRAPHPSGRWLNAHPEDRAKIVAALTEARRLARTA